MPKKSNIIRRKDKSVAVVLAILFGILAWLYTYRDDAWKFWLNLAMLIVTMGLWGPVAWLWVVIDTCIKKKEYFEKFYQI